MTYGDVPRRIVSDTNGGMGGWLAINTQTVESEDDLREVLGFIDSLLDEEPFTLMTQGIEGEHYEVDDDGRSEERRVGKEWREGGAEWEGGRRETAQGEERSEVGT